MSAKEIPNFVKNSNFGEFLKLPVVFDRLGTNGKIHFGYKLKYIKNGALTH